MPEAFAVLLVFAVCAFVYVFALIRTRDPANQDPDEDRARLRVQRAWLEEKLKVATRENWSDEMKASLTAQLEANLSEQARSDEGSGP